MRVFMGTMGVSLLMMVFAVSANAQMYGIGMQPGAQACGYETQMGDGVTDVKDDIAEQTELLKEKREELRDAKARQKELARTLESSKSQIERRGISSEYLEVIITHITSNAKCSEYGLVAGKRYGAVENDGSRMPASKESDAVDHVAAGQGFRPMPSNGTAVRTPADEAVAPSTQGAPPVEVSGGGNLSFAPYTIEDWGNICNMRKSGSVMESACTRPREARVDKIYNEQICKTNLRTYQDTLDKHAKAEALVATLEGEVEIAKDTIRALKGELRTAMRERQREMRESQTEGGCVECMINGSGGGQVVRKSSGMENLVNFGLGLTSMYFGSKDQREATEWHAKRGRDYTPVPTLAYGYPFMMAGLYGAIGGGVGQGAFGCASGVGGTGNGNGPYGMMGPFGNGGMYGNNGGAFGYPNGMYGNGQMGGGMYLPGMGSWGMNGPMGGMGNGMMGGIGGGMMGYPMGGGGMGGGMMGMPMGTGMDMSQMQMQMQQQAMQMQMQQYQQYMQMQQRYQENYMAKQRVVSGLTQELQSLMMRLQQAQMGMSTGGYLGFDSGMGIGTGYQQQPYPNNGLPPTGSVTPGGYYPPTGTVAPTGSTGPSVR